MLIAGGYECSRRKLSATVDIRKTSLAKDKTILESSFHLYRVCADLVIYIQYMSNRVSKRFYQKFHLLFWQVFIDFEILFNEINSAALVEMWPKINVKFATLTPFNEAVNVDYDDQLQDFLVFMKTFPSYHYRFMSSLNALFVFCEVSLGFL